MYLSSIEDVENLREDWVVFTLMLLADELDITQFAKVKVSLLLQAIHGHLQVHQLHVEENSIRKTAFPSQIVILRCLKKNDNTG